MRKENLDVRPSEELAYWIGVVQSDGYFKKYFDKIRKNMHYLISLKVAEKSLPMQRKFLEISKNLLNRHSGSFKDNKRNYWEAKIGVKSLLEDFNKLDINFRDPPNPPSWTMVNERLFGPYLAGLIDGDGDVRIKRKRYPQCVIRISNSNKQIELANVISKILNCSVSITKRGGLKDIEGRKFFGYCYSLEFYVSKKNFKFIRDFVILYLTIRYKKNKLKKYINSRWPQWRSLVSVQACGA